MMSDKNIPKGEKSKKILLTEQEDIYNNNLIEKNKNIKKDNEEENYKNKKYLKENQIKILSQKIIMDMMKLIIWKELLIIIHILNLFIQEKKDYKRISL